MITLTRQDHAILLPVKVVSNASRDKVAGELDGVLKITVAAAPERGAANKAVCKLVARSLGLRVGQISVASGPTSPNKVLRIDGSDVDHLRRAWPNLEWAATNDVP